MLQCVCEHLWDCQLLLSLFLSLVFVSNEQCLSPGEQVSSASLARAVLRWDQ